jgi:ADP-ribose pyrophosphatase YjhB (NUDIX family)
VRIRLLYRSEDRRRHHHQNRFGADRPGQVREAREECGLEVRLDGLVNIYSYPGRAPVIVVYAATSIGGALCGDDECLEAAEFESVSIPWDDLAFRSTRDGLRDYLAGLLHPVHG